MTIFEEIEQYVKRNEGNDNDALVLLEDEIREGISLYWETAARILDGSGTRLLDPPEGFFALRNNFFSGLFLYSFHRAGIARERRVLYAAVNQCIRGMVTGCDNLMDDEYKKTLDTDLPEEGTRFRSVLDIMVSDRVLFDILARAMPGEQEKVRDASAISLRALVRSGAQEAGEQAGTGPILPPEEVLRTVHHFKTGLLFQSPWAIPAFLEKLPEGSVSAMTQVLYAIGMGCQILDDMVDLPTDLHNRRHNYIVSLIYHELGNAGRNRLDALTASNRLDGVDILSDFPEAKAAAGKKSRQFLETGLMTLFEPRHQFLVEPAIDFFAKRIGAALIRL